MKKLFSSVALMALSFILSAPAETIRMFAYDVGELNSAASSMAGWGNQIKPILERDDAPDFGFITSMKGEGSYLYSAAALSSYGHKFKTGLVTWWHYGLEFIYRSDSFDFVEELTTAALGNGTIFGYVIRSKDDLDRVYIPIFVSASNKSFTNLGTFISAAEEKYSGARFFVSFLNRKMTSPADFEAYLTGTLAFSSAAGADLVGQIYQKSGDAFPDETISEVFSAFEGNADSTGGFMGTFVYKPSFVVKFLDAEGEIIGCPQNVKQGASATPPTVPEIEGYDFMGWDKSYEDVQEDLTIRAQYAIKTFTVTFKDWDGAQLGDVQTVEYGKDATPPADPERAGYRFTGWDGVYTDVKADQVVTAKYIEAAAKTYWVTFVDYDGAEIAKEEVVEGSSASLPANPVREGYDFAGWSGTYENVQQDEVVTATYRIKTYTVSFVDANDELIEAQTIDWHSAATPPEPPVVAGHTFSVWMGNWENVEQDEVVKATYEVNFYTVTFVSEGDVLSEQSIEYQKSAQAPDEPHSKNESLVFANWSTDYDFIVEDTTVEAVFVNGVVTVDSAEQFSDVVAGARNPRMVIRLLNDLDFSTVTSYAAPELVATFDGNGFSVSNLSVNSALFGTARGCVKNVRLAGFNRVYKGYNTKGALLADRLEGANVSGVIVENSTVSASNSSCGLATIAYIATTNSEGTVSVVSNCLVRNCRLAGIDRNIVGGIVGEAFDGCEVVDCRFLSDAKDELSLGGANVGRVGGIVGISQGARIRRCFTEGFYKGGTTEDKQLSGVGGIVGFVSDRETEVLDCTNTATVLYCNYNGAAGGIVGRGMKTTLRVTGCVNEGRVEVSADTDNDSYPGCGAGGIFGGGWGNMGVIVVGSKNMGTVTSADSRPAGGIVGESNGTETSGTVSCRFTNCVNTASVASCRWAGGIAGRLNKLEDNFAIVNCGNVGEVSCPTGNVGGVVGEIVGIGQNNDKNFHYANLYNIMNCGGLMTDTGVVGKFVGVLKGSARNAYDAQLKSVFFIDREDTGVVGTVEGKEGTGVTVDEASQIAMGRESFFGSKAAVKKLNVYARANGLPRWVQTKEHPDLSLFSVGIKSGIVLLMW